MKIAISSGHGKYIRGASGSPVPPQLDEVDEARRVVNRVAELWGEAGIETYVFHDDTSHDQGTNLSNIVNHHNNSFGGHGHDLDISVHFNAYNGTANGTEVWHYSMPSLAEDVSAAMSTAMGTVDRGDKQTSDLYFLNNTREKALLLEVVFCDNTSDSTKYDEGFEELCVSIAESIAGITIGDQPPERPERPPRPKPEEENKLVITMQGYGDLVVNINGRRFVAGDDPDNCPVVNMTMECPEHAEDLTVVINGQAYHGPFPGKPEGPAKQQDIFATKFGGAADNEHSAYPPYDSNGQGEYLNDTDLYVSLPAAIDDAEKRERGVKVFYRVTGRSCVAPVKDKGPWVINDPYWETSTRPIAETCYDNHDPLPAGSGNNAGKVPSNPAGIDLSPGVFKALGLEDNDLVDWDWVEPEVS